MNQQFELTSNPHTRLNIMTGEWVLVSPHRTKRPWQGKIENVMADNRPEYLSECYLCPGNKRADGAVNPNYTNNFIFENDYAALVSSTPEGSLNEEDLLIASNRKGICEVISFSPRHNLTLPELELDQITSIVDVWQQQFNKLSAVEWIKYIQIFENKGEIMGCSNPHPHGQIWSQSDIPLEIVKESERQKTYFAVNNRSLLADYLKLEQKKQERIIFENKHFVVLVPFWAVWPYETMIISKRLVPSIKYFSSAEKLSLAKAIKILTIKYDNLFETSFPYSAGMHQQPVNGGEYPEWHWHMHFYPPLLRSATVKKYMVGYELLANPQRDITAELAADTLRKMSDVHYKMKTKQL